MPQNAILLTSGGFDFYFDENEISSLNCISLSPESFSILSDKEKIVGKVVKNRSQRNSYKVEIDGEYFDVSIKSDLDQLMQNLGLNLSVINKLKVIKSPMPGMVIEINVEEGQKVDENQKILVLEAMKMENVLKIPHDAVIKKLLIKKGQAVEKGQILVELD